MRPIHLRHLLAACLGALVAASAVAAARTGRPPHGLLVGAFGGPEPYTRTILGYELPSGKRTVLRKDDQRGDPFFASLSPDGTKLAFLWAAPGMGTPELRVSGRDGSRERTIASGTGSKVMLWSADGTLLLVEGRTTEYIIDPEANVFWTWCPCGGAPAPATLKWTADGRGVVVWQRFSHEPDGGDDVLRCDFDGRVQKLLVVPPTGVMVRLAMAPDEKQIVMADGGNTRLLLKDTSQAAARTVLSLPELDNLIVFLSPDGKWAGAVGQVHATKVPTPPLVVLKRIADGAMRTLRLPPTRDIQWWAPSSTPGIDERAIVRAALGPGKPFTPPLTVPGPS